MKTNKLARWALCASLLVAPFAACVPADDAGDISFVIEATQMVLGRKPRGTAEVQSLLGVLQSHGRGAVIDVLMEEPDYVEYWLPVVADAMQVQQSGDFRQKDDCFDHTIYMRDAANHDCATSDCKTNASNLANHIRNDLPKNRTFDPDDDGAPNAFNMNDVLRAALIADDLHVAWRPWMFLLAGKKDTTKAGLIETRDNFMVSAFNVQTGCISCHSATYSKTEVYTGSKYGAHYDGNNWDRTAVLGYDLERATFGKRTTLDLDDDPECYRSTSTGLLIQPPVSNVYHNRCGSTCHGDDGNSLPTISGGHSPKALTARVSVLTEDEIVAQILNGGGDMHSVDDLDGDGVLGPDDPDEETCARKIAAFLREQLGGYEDFGHYLDKPQFDTPTSITSSACATGPAPQTQGPWGLDPTACGIAWTEDRVCDAGGQDYMFAGQPRHNTDVANVTGVVKAGLTGLKTEPGSLVTTTADRDLPSTSSPEVSVAMLLVQNIADDLLFEVSSNRTTVAHGLPRTTAQANALQYMISQMLVQDPGGPVRISLKNGLKQAVLSTLFNRTTPAYDFDTYFNPWPAHDPNSPLPADPAAGDDRNGLGDLVHRRSPNQLLWSLHQDLGWTKPPFWVKGRTSFPSEDFEDDIGRYQSPTMQQSPVWDLNSFTILESQVGMCYDAGKPQDWIGQLANGIFDNTVQVCSPTCAAPTIRQILLGTKDRLIQDPSFDTVARGGLLEETVTRTLVTNELVAAPAGAPAACTNDILNCKANLWTKPAINVLLRKYCSGVLMSPAYLMANLPTVTTSRPLPAVTFCLSGEICKKADLDLHYADALCRLHITCP